MNNKELIHLLARDSSVAPAAAADRLESAVARIVKRLRRGSPVALPGIGVLQPAQPNSGVVLKPVAVKSAKRGARRS
ncbi:MAG: hypothetical protein JNK87_25865 [Bryobacterales bacterium]|nr:hypothetical protein [Bryobacterales bacterium]